MQKTGEAPTLGEQIACVEREISMRERTYPRWVKDRKMMQSTAELELDRMRAVLATLRALTSAPRFLA